MAQSSVLQQPVAHPLHHKHHQDAQEQGNRPEWVKEALKKSHGIGKIVHQSVFANIETKPQKLNKEESIFKVQMNKRERGAQGTSPSGSQRN